MDTPERLRADLRSELPKEIMSRLIRLSEKTGKHKTYFIRMALLEYLTEMEARYLPTERVQKPIKLAILDDFE